MQCTYVRVYITNQARQWQVLKHCFAVALSHRSAARMVKLVLEKYVIVSDHKARQPANVVNVRGLLVEVVE